MKIKYYGFVLLGFAVISLVAIPAIGQPVCKADLEKFCKGSFGQPGQVKKCLYENRDLLSSDCQKQVQKMKQKRRSGRRACQSDREKFCPQLKPGEGRVLACLVKNRSGLSPVCQKKVERWEKREALRTACKADKEKYCNNAPRDKRGIRACMRAHQDQLSKKCKGAIEEMKRSRRIRSGPPQISLWQTIKSPIS